MNKKFLFVFFLLLLPLAVLTVQCLHEAPEVTLNDHRKVELGLGNEKIYCDVSLKNEFAGNRVVIVLNKEASLNFKSYTPEDFHEVNCTMVTDSTAYTLELVRKQLEAEKTGDCSELKEYVELGMLVDIENFRRILDIHFAKDSKENILNAINLLERREDIIYAGPDFFIEFDALPSPLPYYYNSQQASVFNRISLPQAWDVETGSSGIMVGVIDTGIQGNHPALYNRVDASLSRDFSTGIAGGLALPSGPTDSHGHGTHIGGTISTNGTGVSGVCWNLTLVSLNIAIPTGSSLLSNVSNVRYAIDYATGKKIPILNHSGRITVYNSSTGGTNANYNQSIDVYYAIRDFPGLYVCTAGNGTDGNGIGKNNDTVPQYPANFTTILPNIITVGATNKTDENRAPYSNWGAKSVDIFTHGSDIYSTLPGNAYGSMSGTSMAAPIVTGVAALIKSHIPTLPAAHIKQIIMKNVRLYSDPTLGKLCISGGVLNVANIFNLYGGGTGTPINPYIITTADHLNNIRYLGNSNRYFKLGSNINLQNDQWAPIESFNGNFDGNSGNGYTISNLKMTYTSNDSLGYGLFQNNYGTIHNLKVTANINFQNYNGSYVDTAKPVGVIAVRNYGEISNCQVSASGSDPMIYCKTYYTDRVGGIAAYNSGNIYSCKNNGVIYSGGDTGGIAGYNMGIITDCENNALICYTLSDNRISKIHSIGGIAGINYYNVSNVINKAMILYGGYSQVNDKVLQPRMAHIIGTNDNSVSSASWTSSASVNKGNLISFSWTENGTTYTHNQALYVRNAAVGVQY